MPPIGECNSNLTYADI